MRITAMAKNQYSSGAKNCFKTKKTKPAMKIMIGVKER